MDVLGSAPTHTLNSPHWVFASELISEGWTDWWAVICPSILSSDSHGQLSQTGWSVYNGEGIKIKLIGSERTYLGRYPDARYSVMSKAMYITYSSSQT